jgi:hypothetical protein
MLAVFGSQAPTLIAGDKIITLPGPGKIDTNMDKKEEGGKLNVPYLPVYVKSIYTAATDWNLIRSRHQLRIVGPRSGKEEFSNKTKAVTSVAGPSLKPFYALVKEYAYAVDVIDVDTSKKRKAVGVASSEEDAENRAKKAKDLRDVASLFK